MFCFHFWFPCFVLISQALFWWVSFRSLLFIFKPLFRFADQNSPRNSTKATKRPHSWLKSAMRTKSLNVYWCLSDYDCDRLKLQNVHVFYRYTSKGATAYAMVLTWPSTGNLTLGAYTPTASTTVSMLGVAGKLNWKKNLKMGIDVQFPMVPISQMPSTDAWVLKLMN